nr:Ig-like domain-containing protein [Granulosicoccus sp.]
MTIKLSALIAPVVLLLSACGSDTNYNFDAQEEINDATTAALDPPEALFSPADGVLPFPSSLLLQGSEDGTINIPVADPGDLSDPQVALNQMDGFSTVAPISAAVSRPVDAATVVLGQTVRVFEITADPVTTVITGIVAELGNTDVAVTTQGNQIVIIPVRPLKEKTSYLVALTSGITDASDVPEALAPSLSYRLVTGSTELTGPVGSQLEPLRQLTLAQLGALTGAGVEASEVVLSWTFQTQSISDVLQAVKNQTTAQPLVVVNSSLTTSFVDGLAGKADVYIGTLDLPYYQTAPAAENPDFDAVLNGFWTAANGGFVTRFNPAPESTTTVTVPVLMTTPNGNSAVGGTAPASGWPVTIFQHGITRNRTDMLALADAMADAGRAMIAIDLPMHGLVNPTDAIHAESTAFPTDQERTFGIDVLGMETEDGEVGDGIPDPS